MSSPKPAACRTRAGSVPTAAAHSASPPLPSTPAAVAAPDRYADVDSRQALRAALAQLPPGQRAVVVLRYHQDLPEAQVAELLGAGVVATS